MQQHPVPQNVTGFQFKLIGDMTVTQFIYLAAGTLIAYLITKQVEEAIFKWPLATLSFGAGFAFAFMPFEDRPLDTWVKNFVKAIYAPTMFLWEKDIVIPEILKPSYAPISYATASIKGIGVDKRLMEEYVQSLPQNGFLPADNEEQNRLKSLLDQFKKEFQETVSANTFSDNGLSGIKDRTEQTDQNTLATVSSPTRQVISVVSGSGNARIIPSVGQVKVRPLGKGVGDQKTQNKPEKPQEEQKEEVVNININISQTANQNRLKPEPKKESDAMQKAVESLTHESFGAKIINLSSITKTAKSATKKLPVSGIGEEEIPLPQETEELEKIKKELEEKIKTEGINDQKTKDYLKKLQDQLTSSLAEKQKLEEELEKTKEAFREKETNEQTVVPQETMEPEKKSATTVKFVPAQMSAKVGVQQPQSPNILCGIVKDQYGDILPDVLMEIKDKNGKTERALKSNKLGQFGIATPLDNGTYTIHLEDARGLFQFDIIEVMLTGTIFPAMEIKAKSQKDAEREKLKEALFGKQG